MFIYSSVQHIQSKDAGHMLYHWAKSPAFEVICQLFFDYLMKSFRPSFQKKYMCQHTINTKSFRELMDPLELFLFCGFGSHLE